MKNDEVKKVEEVSSCNGDCVCNKDSGDKGIKFLISLIVLVAVIVIVGYKISARNKVIASKKASTEKSEYISKSILSSKTARVSDSKVMTQENEVKFLPRTEDKIGEYLDSIKNLNDVASNLDVAFIFVPDVNNPIKTPTKKAIFNAQESMKKNKINVGLFTLLPTAPEFKIIKKQVHSRSLIVAVKGRGMSAVSGGITENKILQVYTAVNNTSSCGTSGCGASGCR